MESRNIYLYWVGKEYKLISILRNLIYLHSTSGKGYKVNLITEHNIKDYIKDIPEYFNKLLPAHQADFVRVHVICDYGGIWLDSDTLVLDSLDTLFHFIETNDGFFIKENNNILWNGIFGSKPNTPFMNKWKTDMMNKLNNTQGKIEWSDIGCIMLQSIYTTNKALYDNYKIFNGLDNLYPVNWNNCVKEFLDKPYDNYKSILREYQPLVVLVNSVYKRLESMTEQEILAGKMPLNYFINKSLEKKGISKNLMYTNQFIFNYGIRDYISKSIIDHKCWEPNISSIFDSILKNNKNKESVVIDIGCNLGYYSILSANNTGISKIYGIDANIDNIYMLKLSSAINNIKHIESLQFCISEKTGDFFKPSNKEFAKKVGNIGGMAYAKTSDNVNNDTSISTTIDEIVKMKSITDIIIMKIDIEGGELNALKGASETLKNDIIKNIIIEISPKFNNDSLEIMQILKNNNYHLYNIPQIETGKYNNTDILSNVCKNPIKDIETFVKSIGIQTNILAIKSQEPNILTIKNKGIKKYVIYADWIKSYLTKEPYTFVKNLEMFDWELIELSRLNAEYIKTHKCIVLCVTYDDFDISLIKCENIKIIYKMDDIYPYKDIRKKCIQNADIIISPYQYLFNNDEIKSMYADIHLTKSFHIPYSAVNDFFKDIDFNNSPINKIFVSGAVNDIYPLRKYVKTDGIFKEYIDILEHPSYSNYTHRFINELYYKKMNDYVCCFVDASRYKYILLKVFETCSVGSLLLVDDTISCELNKMGFYDTINCIFCNKTNVKDKMEWILNIENRQLVDNMRNLGMDLVRNKHTTMNRSVQLNNSISLTLCQNENKSIFENIYEKHLWNDGNINIPLSGPGSSLENTKECSKMLNDFIYNNHCKTVIDLGCGDLTWIPKMPFFNDSNIKYTGIDIVESLINSHTEKYPGKLFINADISIYNNFDNVDIIIIRDVIFHLKNKDIISIFYNIKNKFKYILITSCINDVNTDIFDRWHFSQKNIHIEPFNIPRNFEMKIYEEAFKRNVYIYSHNTFYNIISP